VPKKETGCGGRMSRCLALFPNALFHPCSQWRPNSFDAARVLMSAQMRPVAGVFFMSFCTQAGKIEIPIYLCCRRFFFIQSSSGEHLRRYKILTPH
jgi:hypothetical protein